MSTALIFHLALFVLICAPGCRDCDQAVDQGDGASVCLKMSPPTRPKPRRYDVSDLGYLQYFRGWVDVQGQGAANDYCRLVGIEPAIFLACALAGTHGEYEYAYVSSSDKFDRGHLNTWYMKDEDGDGRDDYCRCVGDGNQQQVMCTKAGPKGFYGSAAQGGNSLTFTPTGKIQCKDRKVRPEFGKLHAF